MHGFNIQKACQLRLSLIYFLFQITEKLDEVGAVRWTPERFQNYSRCKEQYEKQRTEHNCADIKGEGLDQTACLWEKYFCRVELAVFDMWTLR